MPFRNYNVIVFRQTDTRDREKQFKHNGKAFRYLFTGFMKNKIERFIIAITNTKIKLYYINELLFKQKYNVISMKLRKRN